MKIFPLLLFVLFAACKGTMPAGKVQQGVEGIVWWLEGDFMPRIGENPPGKREAVRREVIFYKVLSLEDLHPESGPLFTAIPGEEVASVTSGEDGKFKVMLPEGIYSVFTKEPKGFFANSFDGEGQINAVTVQKGEITRLIIDINYQATY